MLELQNALHQVTRFNNLRKNIYAQRIFQFFIILWNGIEKYLKLKPQSAIPLKKKTLQYMVLIILYK